MDFHACQYPFWIGRLAGSGIRLEEPGVWDRHLEVLFDRHEGFSARVEGSAMVTLNGERFSEGPIRNGDVLGLGGVRLQFWLAAVRPASFRVREAMTWIGVLALAALQVGIVYWIAR